MDEKVEQKEKKEKGVTKEQIHEYYLENKRAYEAVVISGSIVAMSLCFLILIIAVDNFSLISGAILFCGFFLTLSLNFCTLRKMVQGTDLLLEEDKESHRAGLALIKAAKRVDLHRDSIFVVTALLMAVFALISAALGYR